MLEIAFWVFSAVAVGAGIAAISIKNPLYCALSLVVSFISLAGLYFQLKAAFPGVLQVMLYAGAIMVLVLFVIMFLNMPDEERSSDEISKPGIVLSVFLLVPLAATLIGVMWTSDLPRFGPVGDEFGGVASTGKELFTTWLYPFEILSLLIVAAMVGAVLLAKKRID